MLVPFNCDIVIGEAQMTFTNTQQFIERMQKQYQQLTRYCITQVMEQDN